MRSWVKRKTNYFCLLCHSVSVCCVCMCFWFLFCSLFCANHTDIIKCVTHLTCMYRCWNVSLLFSESITYLKQVILRWKSFLPTTLISCTCLSKHAHLSLSIQKLIACYQKYNAMYCKCLYNPKLKTERQKYFHFVHFDRFCIHALHK